MANQILVALPRVTNSTGAVAAGAKVLFYQTGTTTPLTVYSDTALTTPHPSPLVADAGGKLAQVFYDGSVAAKYIVNDASDVLIFQQDPAPTATVSSSAASSVSFVPSTDNPQTNVQDAVDYVSGLYSALADSTVPTYPSKALAQAADIALTVDNLLVLESGEVMVYYRDASGTDLTTNDGAKWTIGNVTQADLLGLATDIQTAIGPVSGAFTPTLSFATPGTMSVSYGATQVGWYQKVGNVVYNTVNLNTATITKGTASGNFRLEFNDHPYTPAASNVGGGRIRFKPSQITIPTGATVCAPLVAVSAKYLEFAYWGLTGGTSYLALADVGTTAMVLQLEFEFRV